MFGKNYSDDHRRALDKTVNTEEHLSQLSPSEIADEMENIFLDNDSDDMDVDQLIAYLDYLDKVAPVEDPRGAEDTAQRVLEQHAAHTEDTASKAPRRFLVRRRIFSLVAVIMILVGVICAIAYANNPKEAKQTDETFTFGDAPTGTYTSLQEALDAYGVKEKLVPKWLPSDYLVAEIQATERKTDRTFFAQYVGVENSENNLTITIRENLTPNMQATYEKDDTGIDKFLIGSTTYYVSQDQGYTNIKWTVDTYECAISGVIAEEDISKIIDSIA